jgi:RNA polymerase sigma-70 factor (ECF subfamily)
MNDERKTRPSLLVKLRNLQDRESWNEFLELYGPLIVRCLRRLGVPKQDVEDLYHDVLGVLARRMPTFEYDLAGSFRAYLATIVKNRVIRYFSERHRQPQPIGKKSGWDLESQVADVHDRLGDWIEEEWRRRRLQLAMKKVRDEVKPQTWTVFELRVFQHRSPQEVAEQLRISVNTVNTSYSRVRKRLRAAVEEIDE